MMYVQDAFDWDKLSNFNQLWVNLCGFIAAITSFRAGWKATALPPAPATMTSGTLSPTPETVSVTVGTSPLDSEDYQDVLGMEPLTAEEVEGVDGYSKDA
jgi:hypothetical protein